jgi:hypothetical protein
MLVPVQRHTQASEPHSLVKVPRSRALLVLHIQVPRALHSLEQLEGLLPRLDRWSWLQTRMLRPHTDPSSCGPP